VLLKLKCSGGEADVVKRTGWGVTTAHGEDWEVGGMEGKGREGRFRDKRPQTAESSRKGWGSGRGHVSYMNGIRVRARQGMFVLLDAGAPAVASIRTHKHAHPCSYPSHAVVHPYVWALPYCTDVGANLVQHCRAGFGLTLPARCELWSPVAGASLPLSLLINRVMVAGLRFVVRHCSLV
jgi:hypothetical protein